MLCFASLPNVQNYFGGGTLYRTSRHFGSKKWDKPRKSGFGNFFFDFFKSAWNFLRWCGIGLGVSFGSQGISIAILGHMQSIFEIFSKGQNSTGEVDFSSSSCIWLAKTRFSYMSSGFMSLRITSYEQTLLARRTLGHYLKLLGPDFSYCFYFLKKIIFFALMTQNAAKLA